VLKWVRRFGGEHEDQRRLVARARVISSPCPPDLALHATVEEAMSEEVAKLVWIGRPARGAGSGADQR
jgi:hypothetical protein